MRTRRPHSCRGNATAHTVERQSLSVRAGHSGRRGVTHLCTELPGAGPPTRDSPAELLVGQHEAFQPDGELHVTAAHHVLDLEVQELGWEAQLLHDPGILPRCKAGLLFTRERGVGAVDTRGQLKELLQQAAPSKGWTGHPFPVRVKIRRHKLLYCEVILCPWQETGLPKRPPFQCTKSQTDTNVQV